MQLGGEGHGMTTDTAGGTIAMIAMATATTTTETATETGTDIETGDSEVRHLRGCVSRSWPSVSVHAHH